MPETVANYVTHVMRGRFSSRFGCQWPHLSELPGTTWILNAQSSVAGFFHTMLFNGFVLLCVAALSAALGAWWASRGCGRRTPNETTDICLIDRTTGLFNHTAMHDLLARQLSLAERLRRPITVLMVELDTQASTETIRPLAERLQSRLRTHDVLGRWSDKRFLAVLPVTDVPNALVLAGDLRRLAAEVVAPDATGASISVGVHGRELIVGACDWSELATEMAGAAQRALDDTVRNGPGRIEIER